MLSNSDPIEGADQIQAKPARPKAFISYSWSSPGHQERVRLWAERLLQDGIDVVLDVFDLKEGHDKFTFMEKMVTDPSVTHVLVICDKAYSDKANARRAGVGTESQIISKEVYEKVEQSKFIPLVCEFSDDREPHLPMFFRSRIWIDFSSLEAVNDNWEQLVRALYGRPVHSKPKLGEPPFYIANNTKTPVNPGIVKFGTFKQALLQGNRGANAYRREFLSSCVEYADALRVRKSPDMPLFPAKVLEDCGTLKAIRNLITDWVLLESEVADTDEFLASLLGLLEELLELKSRPQEVSSWSAEWFEAHSVFVYETFLYIVASLIKTSSYGVLHEVFTSHYLRPKSERHLENKFVNFGAFYGHAGTLQSVLVPQGKKLKSAAAELIKRQAGRRDISFSAVMEAELLVLLMTFISPEGRWYPQTLNYEYGNEFPFFLRATQHKHFMKLAVITGIGDADSLREAARAGQERLRADSWSQFISTYRSFGECMNLDRLDTLK